MRRPLQPKIATSFSDMAGYMRPRAFMRLPHGNVLATVQHEHHGGATASGGKVMRCASNADPAFASALLVPYGLAVLPALDRVLSTN